MRFVAVVDKRFIRQSGTKKQAVR